MANHAARPQGAVQSRRSGGSVPSCRRRASRSPSPMRWAPGVAGVRGAWPSRTRANTGVTYLALPGLGIAIHASHRSEGAWPRRRPSTSRMTRHSRPTRTFARLDQPTGDIFDGQASMMVFSKSSSLVPLLIKHATSGSARLRHRADWTALARLAELPERAGLDQRRPRVGLEPQGAPFSAIEAGFGLFAVPERSIPGRRQAVAHFPDVTGRIAPPSTHNQRRRLLMAGAERPSPAQPSGIRRVNGRRRHEDSSAGLIKELRHSRL
jgi:hypothetical protein